jgi:hypothetical protein
MAARDPDSTERRRPGARNWAPEIIRFSAGLALIGLLCVISSLLTSRTTRIDVPASPDQSPPPTVALPAFSAPGFTEAPGIEAFLDSKSYPEISYLAVRPSLISDSTAPEQILFSAYDDNSGVNLFRSPGSDKVERLADDLPCTFYRELAHITRDGRLLACLKGARMRAANPSLSSR